MKGIRFSCGLLLSIFAAPGPQLCRSDEPRPFEWIRVSDDKTHFVGDQSGKKIVIWGVNYDHDEPRRLLEDYWHKQWATVVEDFQEIKELGANAVRVHLQLPKFMDTAQQPNEANLAQLAKLVRLAEETGLYLDITGLGCYHKQDVPKWCDELDEAARWDVQARFWQAVARVCRDSPAVFCYDLMNEPILPGETKETQWLAGELGGKYFVQRITLDLAGRTRNEVARDWVKKLTTSIREIDNRHLITVGEIPWAYVFKGAKPFFHAPDVGGPLEFVSVHFYPKKGDVEGALDALAVYEIGKPLVIEETFPLGCSIEEAGAFIQGSRKHADGWISFYWGKTLLETPREIPLKFPLDKSKLRQRFDEIADHSGELLSEDDSKQLLATYGIQVVLPRSAASADEAAALAAEIGYPVVLKIHSPQLTHKTDVGGVALNLVDEAAVRRAFNEMTGSARRLRPDAQILGVTVQRMVTAVHGVELILGVKRDPVFGPVMMVGFGGVAAEVFQDVALELPPLNERLATRMLQSLRSWPLLTGYRGRPVVHVDQLVETLMRFSYLVAHLPEIREVDINPLLATPTEVIALDARVLIDRVAAPSPARPHSHLAICPYPEQYTETAYLPDGTQIHIRAIKPEDEPAWKDLLRRSSAESLWKRFRYLFKEATHEMASRFCFIDYDRELALCVEIVQDDQPLLIAVARLVADPDHEAADYGILVADAFQHHGLGRLLTQKCIDIGRRWALKRITGETTTDNLAMIRIFRDLGFKVEHRSEHQAVLARLSLHT